jgi:hypothetical protein
VGSSERTGARRLIIGDEELTRLIPVGRDRARHVWFLEDAPQPFDRGQEVLARTASERRFGGDGNVVTAALPVGQVRYYGTHSTSFDGCTSPLGEMTTGVR